MGDETVETQPILTSTMGNVLLSQNNGNKNDANDSLPTSSTDADSTYAKSLSSASEDPISSTSSDLSEKQKVSNSNTENFKKIQMDSPKSHPETDIELDINTVTAPTEPTNENVEDIAQDLENLLGESDPNDDYLTQKKVTNKNEPDLSQTSLEDLANELDATTSQSIENDETDHLPVKISEIFPEKVEEKCVETKEKVGIATECNKNISSQPEEVVLEISNKLVPDKNKVESQKNSAQCENEEPESKEELTITKLVENEGIPAKTLEEELLVQKITRAESSETHSIASSLEVLPDPETTNLDDFVNPAPEDVSLNSLQNTNEYEKINENAFCKVDTKNKTESVEIPQEIAEPLRETTEIVDTAPSLTPNCLESMETEVTEATSEKVIESAKISKPADEERSETAKVAPTNIPTETVKVSPETDHKTEESSMNLEKTPEVETTPVGEILPETLEEQSAETLKEISSAPIIPEGAVQLPKEATIEDKTEHSEIIIKIDPEKTNEKPDVEIAETLQSDQNIIPQIVEEPKENSTPEIEKNEQQYSIPEKVEKTDDESQKLVEGIIDDFSEENNSKEELFEQKTEKQPVVEEIIQKKTVIYEHDCVHGKHEHSTAKIQDEPEVDSPSSVEYIGSSSSQERLDRDDSNSSSSEMMKIIEKRTLSQLSKDIVQYPTNVEKNNENESQTSSVIDSKDSQNEYITNETIELKDSQIESMDQKDPQVESFEPKDTQIEASEVKTLQVETVELKELQTEVKGEETKEVQPIVSRVEASEVIDTKIETVELDDTRIKASENVEIEADELKKTEIEEVPLKDSEIGAIKSKELQIEAVELKEHQIETDELKKHHTKDVELKISLIEDSKVKAVEHNEKVNDAVCSITLDNTIQDQTTAAVQSILDNMLAEEHNVETVSEKDETHLVHPAYSSYELQKAVQQIQSIQEPQDEPAVETPTVSYIPEVEKYEVPQVSPLVIQQVQEEPKVEPKPVEVPIETKTESKNKKQHEVVHPIVRPTIDLSEESSSSSDESSESEKSSEIEQKNQKSRQATNKSSQSKEKTYSVESISEPLSINIDETDKEKCYSPKITIKLNNKEDDVEDKEEHKGSLKITITKQSDNTHSILKICSPDVENRNKNPENDDHVIPKLVIKTSDMEQHSPKTRGSKQSTSNLNQRSGSPRITIKPILKPDTKEGSPLKMTIKPLGKPEEFSKQQQQQQQRHSPKLPKSKAEDDHYGTRSKIMKVGENEPLHSPKVTIKPIVKPHEEEQQHISTTPKITIKPVEKPEVEAKVSPKITIKPVIKPPEEPEERIVLKINKGNLPVDKPRKREHEEEKLAKIKLKFSKGGDAHIVHESPPKKLKNNSNDSDEDVKIIEDRHSPIVISEDSRSQDSVILVNETKNLLMMHQPEPVIVAPPNPPPPAPRKRGRPRKIPLVVREDFCNPGKEELPPTPQVMPAVSGTETRGRPKRSCRGQSVCDTLGIKPRKTKAPSKPRGGKRGPKGRDQNLSAAKLELIKKTLSDQSGNQDVGLLKLAPIPSNKSLELKGLLEAAKDQNIIEIIEIDSPSSTKSSEDVINEKRGRKNDIDLTKDELGINEMEMQPPTSYFAQPFSSESTMDISHSSDIAMFEEETRMSAEAHSRAQTPAKQVVSSDVIVEESQSSLMSTATTESGKISRRSRLEVHQEIDASISSVDQLNEYYWGGNGPFMIQEQVAQFLGIKSFKRKYPNMPRRVVDMQERDYIRENGLASESMCDLGLTAVNSIDILDIMYSDFQDKYEEYCKYQRDKQAKDLQNKQRALTAAASHEKNKLDIVEQAINSAASYNVNFNKARREQRKACMDLQTMNVHYPKGKMKAVKLPKIGNYPVAIVPGQYVDYYKEFSPTELNNFPINTMLYTELHKILMDGSDSESESSGSDTEESSSSGSESDSSCEDSCKMCNFGEKKSISRKSPSVHASA